MTAAENCLEPVFWHSLYSAAGLSITCRGQFQLAQHLLRMSLIGSFQPATVVCTHPCQSFAVPPPCWAPYGALRPLLPSSWPLVLPPTPPSVRPSNINTHIIIDVCTILQLWLWREGSLYWNFYSKNLEEGGNPYTRDQMHVCMSFWPFCCVRNDCGIPQWQNFRARF